jgi:hypothetical protein|tara:strand:- start:259 stop:456 length:198 start_codon:yes stop_codon:yes gene_type:complete
MASPKKKWLRRKLAEQEALGAESNIQPVPTPEVVDPKKVLVSNPALAPAKSARPIRSSRNRKKKE